MSGDKRYCSFCGKSEDHVLVLIAGPSSFICDECVANSADIAAEHFREKEISKAVAVARNEERDRAARVVQLKIISLGFIGLIRKSGSLGKYLADAINDRAPASASSKQSEAAL